MAIFMKKMLLVTTVNDISLSLFLTQKVKKKLEIDVFFFHEDIAMLKEKLVSEGYDYIYIRDPFNYEFDKTNAEEKIKTILDNKGDAYIIDSLESVEDIYFEDKWNQYLVLKEFMPSTKVLESLEAVDSADSITKKRISSRSEGIVFHSKDLKSDDLSEYIVQEKLKINKEYRVYVLFDEILTTASLKSSKTETSRVRTLGTEELSQDVIEFVKKITEKKNFDFVGLDVVESGGKLYLLEMNRSCLFNGYFRNNNINLAEVFVNKLLEKS
jgi:glutathione synthase/RimK-type ligase-like ATP-grasp enzyme